VKNNDFGNITVLALIAFIFFAACDNAVNQKNNGMEFNINHIVADGSAGNMTTKLTLTLDKDIPDFTVDDIKINAVSFLSSPLTYVSNADFPVIKGILTPKTDVYNTYELTIIPGNSGRIKVGLDPYRGFTGWKAVDVIVYAQFHFKGALELTITGYSGIGGDVTIPEEIAQIPVTAIGTATGTRTEPTVLSFKQLTSVNIPDSVSSIGSYAFANNQLTSVTIPNQVTAIANSTFAYNQLIGIIIPENVTVIGSYAFANNQLNSVTIPQKVDSIGASAFANNQLTSVTLSEGVTRIGADAFFNNQLKSISIPDSVENLSGFSDNLLTAVVIPERVTTIGNNAFSNNLLKNIIIPNNVTSIGSYAFQYNQLTAITIGDKVIIIGNGAFANNLLGNVSIPNEVISIGQSAFQDNQLTTVTIGNRVINIGANAFANNRLISVIIPDSVTTIGSRAFFDNQLTSITIGKNVTLGSTSFGNGFESAYNNDRAAGTYTRTSITSDVWVMK
jgi:hypothetical protein